MFLEKIFPHNSNLILVSADGAYPRDRAFRDLCLKKLASSNTALVAVFNPESLSKITVVSQRVLLLDEYLSQDYRSEEEDRDLGFSLNEEKISFFIESFFRQWEKIESRGSFSFQYNQSNQYHWKESWPKSLLTGLS